MHAHRHTQMCTHTQMLSSVCTLALLDTVHKQTHTHTVFFPICNSFQLKETYLRHSLLSCHFRHHIQQNWRHNSQNFPPAVCCPLRSKDIIPFAALKIRSYTSHVPCLALSGTWLTSLCGICLPLHASCFSLCQTSSSWT